MANLLTIGDVSEVFRELRRSGPRLLTNRLRLSARDATKATWNRGEHAPKNAGAVEFRNTLRVRQLAILAAPS